MQIDYQLYYQIKKYKEHGDFTAIAHSITPPIKNPQITAAMRSRKGSERVVTAITEYYAKEIPKRIKAEQRMKDIEQINQEILNNDR